MVHMIINLLLWAAISHDALGFEAKLIQAGPTKLKLEKKAQLPGVVWGFDFVTDQVILATLKDGRIFQVNLNSGAKKPLSHPLKVFNSAQGGLLDLKAHPHSKKDFYVTYATNSPKGATTELALLHLAKDQLSLKTILMTADAYSSYGVHFGSRVAVDPKGYLYWSIGDRGERHKAQQLSSHHGKILRLTLEGDLPKDNPFAEQKGPQAFIYSYGHRNPQGIIFDEPTNEIWAIEHGPKGGDELNLIQKGANYGWPVITYGEEYSGGKIGGTHKKGMMQPVTYFKPSIAPSSLVRYRGKAFPQWNGDFFAGALVLRHLNHMHMKNQTFEKETRYLESLNQRIRCVREGPKGALYLSTDQGIILSLTKA